MSTHHSDLNADGTSEMGTIPSISQTGSLILLPPGFAD